MSTINPHLESGCKVTWEEVVCQSPCIRGRLAGNSAEVKQIWRQPIPVEGQSSELEVAMEEYYNWELKRLETPRQGAVNPNPTSTKTVTGVGCCQSLKLHLKKATPGAGWTQAK